MSKTSRRPVSMARRAISTGVWPGMMGREATPACWARVCSWSCAAGRWVSRLASRTRFLSRLARRRASLPEVVVLPEPCRPTMSMRDGRRGVEVEGHGAGAAEGLDQHVVDDLDDELAGADAVQHLGAQGALAHGGDEVSTTGRATSASSRARRTSRRASATSASLSAPRARRRSKTPDSLPDSVSNIGSPQTVVRRCASLRGAASWTGAGYGGAGGRSQGLRVAVRRPGTSGRGGPAGVRSAGRSGCGRRGLG